MVLRRTGCNEAKLARWSVALASAHQVLYALAARMQSATSPPLRYWALWCGVERSRFWAPKQGLVFLLVWIVWNLGVSGLLQITCHVLGCCCRFSPFECSWCIRTCYWTLRFESLVISWLSCIWRGEYCSFNFSGHGREGCSTVESLSVCYDKNSSRQIFFQQHLTAGACSNWGWETGVKVCSHHSITAAWVLRSLYRLKIQCTFICCWEFAQIIIRACIFGQMCIDHIFRFDLL